MIDLIHGDCLVEMAKIPDKSVDLIVTDPPYKIDNTKPGNNSKLARSIQHMNNQLQESNLCSGFNLQVLDEMVRIQRNINCYIWCNAKQIPMYLSYFVDRMGCNFDILIWHKSNAVPSFYNKYLTDKEYCLYFRKGGYCSPNSYDSARTVYTQPINIKDKTLYGHPTIKPLNIIQTLVTNSSREGDTVLDMFMGSGTTMVACVNTKRNGIGIELDDNYFKIAQERVKQSQQQLTLF